MNTNTIKQTALSGSRPTGALHLGNYFGALVNYIKMQSDYKAYFFVADYHALTTHPDAKTLNENVKELLATYLAAGLDPEKSTIYLQSHVPEIPELYLLFNMLAYKGELEKVPTFKEKVRSQSQIGKSISMGLITYPVLMAVDILIHRAQKVPVGKDQLPHLEMTRNFANRFNHLTNSNFFPEPEGFNFGNELVKVPSLDGSGKMSASAANQNSALFFNDTDKQLRKKVMRAKTDSGPTEKNQPKTEDVQNLFHLLQLVSKPAVIAALDEQYNEATIRYGDLKKQLADDVVAFMAPIRDKKEALLQKPAYLKEVAHYGAIKARKSAQATLHGAKELMGMNYFE